MNELYKMTPFSFKGPYLISKHCSKRQAFTTQTAEPSGKPQKSWTLTKKLAGVLHYYIPNCDDDTEMAQSSDYQAF